MSSDFSNQDYVDDSPRDRMVLSQFAGDHSEFGYAAFSYGDSSEGFDFGEQVSQLTASGVPTTREAELLKAMRGYHRQLHQVKAMAGHPMEGYNGFEGFDGLWDKLKSTVSGGAKKAVSSATAAASQQIQKTVDTTASQLKSGVSSAITSTASGVKSVVAVPAPAPAPAPAPSIVQRIAEPVQQVATRAAEVVKQNKIPTAVLGIGALALLYFFMRRK
jgi:hypothetical protein